MAFLIKNIKALIQAEETPRLKVAGKMMEQLPIINDAWLLVAGDRIIDFGPMESSPSQNDYGLRITDYEKKTHQLTSSPVHQF